jgi:hypothetical protein
VQLTSDAKKAERRARTLAAAAADPKAPPPRVVLPCVNLGGPTGETRPCQACGGKQIPVPLVACKVYGVCAVGRAVTLEDGTPVRPCNTLCLGYAAADEAKH